MSDIIAIDQAPTMVKDLLQPNAYPEEVSSVQLIETHISYLFLTGTHVYKVKKPVDYGFLDFTTPDRRLYYCQQEVEINRRISSDVYLGVVEIRLHKGHYSVEGPGQTVDYAVKMRQLPGQRALSVLLDQGAIGPEEVRRLARLIAGFHRDATTSDEITRLGGYRTLARNLDENFRQIAGFLDTCLSRDVYDDLLAYSQAFMQQMQPLLESRAQQGYVRDCHGDLHTDNIFLADGFKVIDAIEFNQRFRYSDTGLDIAFLAMDMDFHGHKNLSQELVYCYIQESGDHHLLQVLPFFKVYRACVRGKVTGFRLDAPGLAPADREKIQATAQNYFSQARSYVPRLPSPSLVLVAGLMGSGKSRAARDLSRRWNMVVISSDIVRKDLAEIGASHLAHEPYGQGIYSAEFTARTYNTMLSQAEVHLKAGRSVILDASFSSEATRQGAIAMARRLGIDAWLLECTAPEAEIEARLRRRTERGASISDGRWELFHQQQEDWEPIIEFPDHRYIRIDTGRPTGDTILAILREFYRRLIAGQPS